MAYYRLVNWGSCRWVLCRQLWDLRTRTEVRQFIGHTFDTVACILVSEHVAPPGTRPLVATASKDCSIRLWERDSGACIATYSDAAVGDAFSGLAALPASTASGGGDFVLVATTIRGRVLVYRVTLRGADATVECVKASVPVLPP